MLIDAKYSNKDELLYWELYTRSVDTVGDFALEINSHWENTKKAFLNSGIFNEDEYRKYAIYINKIIDRELGIYIKEPTKVNLDNECIEAINSMYYTIDKDLIESNVYDKIKINTSITDNDYCSFDISSFMHENEYDARYDSIDDMYNID